MAEGRSEHAERVRKFRREHPERMRQYDRKRQESRRLKARAKRLGDRRCPLCGVLLASASVRKRQRVWCDTCLGDPSIHKIIEFTYWMRWYQKKRGIPQSDIVAVLRSFNLADGSAP